ncbi:DUF6694 family lipoprotein [Halodesulfovibrio marinisediminis]|uniref:Uncharacterized protein n=1 Tax=Halodesulfovibrio marinisediminis DSM 17456 TaxID=1121457 RepID=A0A1N6F8I1_9BACT|nr:DUF6694 family lipoprotein [Halodesulfovibrio marinisediminis]SIN91514.1 hypothetical protein SAMN02745161_1163 [Halodesulfovibrio marinisediminis DSM 17456]
MKLKKIITFFAVAALLLGLIGCTPTIDGSSEEAFDTSYEEVMKEVPEKDKLRVKAAFAAFTAKKTLEATLEGTFSKDEIKKKVYAAMDGKTANDILKLTGQDEIKEEEK